MNGWMNWWIMDGRMDGEMNSLLLSLGIRDAPLFSASPTALFLHHPRAAQSHVLEMSGLSF
jgi:hypothetical protein